MISKETAIQAGIFTGVFMAGVITTKAVGWVTAKVRASRAVKAAQATVNPAKDTVAEVVVEVDPMPDSTGLHQ